MNHRFAAALFLPALALTLAPSGQAAPRRKPVRLPQPPAPLILPDTVRVVLTTELGPITLDLDHKHAPLSTENFVAYVDQKRLDGTSFYRAMRLPWGTPPNGLIQAGTQNDPKRVLKPVAHESTTQTGLSHKAWTVSLARYEPGTATADFSILLSDMTGLDADTSGKGDPAGYAAFGRLVEGQDVARKIFDAPTSPTRGEGFLKGQMLETPVKILTVRRVMIPSPAAPAPPTP